MKPVSAAQLDRLLNETEGSVFILKTLLDELITRPQLCDQIIAKANTGRETDELMALDASVRTLGLQNVRVMIIAEKLADAITSKALERNVKTGELITAPPALLQYAIKAAEHFGDDSPHRNVAFAGGLIFDILNMISLQNPDAGKRKKVEALIEESFTQALAIADIGLELGRKRTRLVLEKHVVSIILLNQASYPAMALVFDEYLEHLLKLRKAEISISLQNLATRYQFQGVHTAFTDLLSWPFQIFENLSPALLHCEEPYVLTEKEEINFYDIAAIAFLANHLVLNQKQFKPGMIQAKAIRPELKKFDLQFDASALFKKKE